jgi:hypothetical protein
VALEGGGLMTDPGSLQRSLSPTSSVTVVSPGQTKIARLPLGRWIGHIRSSATQHESDVQKNVN